MPEGFVRLNATVAVTCESCAYVYQYQHELVIPAESAKLRLEGLMASFREGKTEAIAEIKPCPQCGYLQSWMVDLARDKKGFVRGCVASLIGWISFLVVIVLVANFLPSVKFEYIVPVLMLVIVLAYFITRRVTMKNFNPNPTRPVAEKTVPPQVTLPEVTISSN